MELFFFWIISAIVGAAILSRYNKAGTGCLLGALLGPIGWIIAFVMRGNAATEEEKRRHAEQLAQMERIAAAARSPAPTNATVDTPRPPERECPFCAERILAKARVCKHCGREVQPLESE